MECDICKKSARPSHARFSPQTWLKKPVHVLLHFTTTTTKPFPRYTFLLHYIQINHSNMLVCHQTSCASLLHQVLTFGRTQKEQKTISWLTHFPSQKSFHFPINETTKQHKQQQSTKSTTVEPSQTQDAIVKILPCNVARQFLLRHRQQVHFM